MNYRRIKIVICQHAVGRNDSYSLISFLFLGLVKLTFERMFQIWWYQQWFTLLFGWPIRRDLLWTITFLVKTSSNNLMHFISIQNLFCEFFTWHQITVITNNIMSDRRNQQKFIQCRVCKLLWIFFHSKVNQKYVSPYALFNFVHFLCKLQELRLSDALQYAHWARSMFYELAYVDVIILQAQVQINYAPVHCTIYDLLDMSWNIELQDKIIWCAKTGSFILYSLNDRITVNDIIISIEVCREYKHIANQWYFHNRWYVVILMIPISNYLTRFLLWRIWYDWIAFLTKTVIRFCVSDEWHY